MLNKNCKHCQPRAMVTGRFAGAADGHGEGQRQVEALSYFRLLLAHCLVLGTRHGRDLNLKFLTVQVLNCHCLLGCGEMERHGGRTDADRDKTAALDNEEFEKLSKNSRSFKRQTI